MDVLVAEETSLSKPSLVLIELYLTQSDSYTSLLKATYQASNLTNDNDS